MSKKVGRVSGREGAMSKKVGRASGREGGHVEIFENLKKKPTPPHILNDRSLKVHLNRNLAENYEQFCFNYASYDKIDKNV